MLAAGFIGVVSRFIILFNFSVYIIICVYNETRSKTSADKNLLCCTGTFIFNLYTYTINNMT